MRPTKKIEKYKSLQEEIYLNEDYWYHNYDDYEDYEYEDHWYYGSERGWDYVEDSDIYLTNRGYRSPIIIGRMIKMDSIYSRETLRQKRIDEILGLNTFSVIRPKIGDFL